MDFIEYLCGILLINSVLYAIQAENVTNDFVENYIKVKHLREEGFTNFTVSVIHLHQRHNESSKRLLSDDLKRLKRSEEYSKTPVHLNFAAFNVSFDVSLRFNHMMENHHLPVVIRTANGMFAEMGHIEDCYMTGVTSRRGAVSLSYCNGISGSIEDGNFLYRIDPLEPIQDGESEQVLVSKTLVDENPADAGSISQTEEEQDYINQGSRKKRAIPSTTFMIEVALFFDEIFVAHLKSDYNAETVQERINIVSIKYNAIQSKLDLMQEDFGYTVTVKIRSVEFWDTNPSWFVFDPVLKTNLNNFCAGTNDRTDLLDVDHYHLHVGTVGNPSGFANLPGLCGTSKCGVSADRNFYNGYITAHELGHTLSMVHDQVTSCATNPGIMDTSGGGSNSWTSCNLENMEAFLNTDRAACLFQENVSAGDVDALVNAITLDGEIAGLRLSDTEMCEMREAPGWESLYWDLVEGVCTFLICANMNPGAEYSTMTTHNFRMTGSYCGDGMGCSGSNCVPLADLRISNAEVIQGGWTEWGAVSACSKTCGNGMTVKKRTCTNPKPKNAAPCEGPKYVGQICSTDPCPGDSADATLLRKALASEVCTAFVNNGVLSAAEYDGTGDRSSFADDKQCQVKCTAQTGFTPPGGTKYGFMPNGAACIAASSDWFPDQNELPRRSPGFKGYCLNGRCKEFGCDGSNTGVVMDYCGVCGGTNDTCTLVDGVFDSPVGAGIRADFVTLPAGTKMIQFYFINSGMKRWFLEVYDTAGNALVKQSINSNTALNGPINAAGVDWHYVGGKQYLYTAGTITQDVVIKMYNKDGLPNAGIHYGYSLPLAPTTPTTTTTTTTPTTTTTTTPTTTTTTSSPTTTISPSSSARAARSPTTTTTTTTTPTTTTTTPTTTTSTTPTTTTTTPTTTTTTPTTTPTTTTTTPTSTTTTLTTTTTTPTTTTTTPTTTTTTPTTTTTTPTTTTTTTTTTPTTTPTTTTTAPTTTTTTPGDSTAPTPQPPVTTTTVGVTGNSVTTSTATSSGTNATPTGTAGTSSTTSEDKYACRWGMIRCGNGRCIHYYDLCNELNDCGDNTDEEYAVCGADALTHSSLLVSLVLVTLLKMLM